jgi:hypothetical protein
MLTKIQKRFLLFLFGCVGVRLLFVYLARVLSPENLRIMGYLALIPMIGFILIYWFDLRKTGAEVFGDKIWWNDLRPIHAAFYGIFAWMAIQGDRRAWIPLFADVTLGLIAFLHHHFY